MNLQMLDWLIVALFLLGLLWILLISSRYVKNTADFLVAGRCAGRYVLSISQGAAGLGVISVIATFERDYVTGFTSGWWGMMLTPLTLALGIFGWVYYRYRETRCLTMAQFFEKRYSRRFRVFCGMLAWLAGIINYGIFPAVTVRFFIYFCGFPRTFPLLGWHLETYPVLLAVVISTGVLFAILGGQITIMITDFVQGMFLNIALLVMMVFLYLSFNWDDIFQALHQYNLANPNASMLNPIKTTRTEDFNIWYYMIAAFTSIYAARAWQGSSGYSGAALTPHEAKMSSIISSWRELIKAILFLFIPICCFTILNSPDLSPRFNEIAELSRSAIAAIDDPQLQKQFRVTVVFMHLLPTGMVGLFTAVMLAAMITTDNTYMHSWGSIFVQDVIVPLRRRSFTTRQHLWALRASIVFVGLFAFLFSYFFRQNQYILMFFAITGAIYIGGAGSVIIGGLYTKWGGIWGAWAAMLTGAGIALGGMAVQQLKSAWFYPAGPTGKGLLTGQQISFVAMLCSLLMYVSWSWLQKKICKTPDYNLDKLLHRGPYQRAQAESKLLSTVPISRLGRMLGITPEFTFWDRMMLYMKTLWIYGWFTVFLIFTLGELLIGFPDTVWWTLWKFKIQLYFFIGIVTTVWFIWGGTIDIRNLFRRLAADRSADDQDDGRVE